MTAPELSAEERAIVERIEAAPAAEEAFDATAALRRVLALADEWDEHHGDWCCTKGCVNVNGEHIAPGALDGYPLGVVPVPLPMAPCPGTCTCDVAMYLTPLRAAVAGTE